MDRPSTPLGRYGSTGAMRNWIFWRGVRKGLRSKRFAKCGRIAERLNAYYVNARPRGLGLVGSTPALVAGMEIARLAVHSMEPDGMQRRLNTNAPHIVEIRTNVPQRWNGWRFTAEGQFLVSPDGEHITPHRLAGLLWRDAMELRRAGLRSRKEAEKRVRRGPVKVVVVDLADWHARHFGSRAG